MDGSRLFEIATHLLSNGYAVHMLALDARGHLAHMILGNEETTKRTEDVSLFRARSFYQWQARYPFCYADMPPGSVANETMLRSLEGIGMEGEGALDSPIVLVTDAELSQIPANLFLRGERFAGLRSPVAWLPSIDWLQWSHENRRSMNGRRSAWIPAPVDAGHYADPLAVLAERLRPTFDQHGIEFVNDSLAPPSLVDRDLAVVGAHGGLVPGEGNFQVLKSDSDRRWMPDAFEHSLADCGIVVLFVCSGGRVEFNRHDLATFSLATRLLAAGCRAVVASPWPLSVSAAAHWLPTFVAQLEMGAAVGEAAWRANLHVLDRLGGDPADGLAMHVYGDPLQTLANR